MNRRRNILWLAANTLMLLVLLAVVWAILLPAIWGPNDEAVGEFGDRRNRTERR